MAHFIHALYQVCIAHFTYALYQICIAQFINVSSMYFTLCTCYIKNALHTLYMLRTKYELHTFYMAPGMHWIFWQFNPFLLALHIIWSDFLFNGWHCMLCNKENYCIGESEFVTNYMLHYIPWLFLYFF